MTSSAPSLGTPFGVVMTIGKGNCKSGRTQRRLISHEAGDGTDRLGVGEVQVGGPCAGRADHAWERESGNR